MFAGAGGLTVVVLLAVAIFAVCGGNGDGAVAATTGAAAPTSAPPTQPTIPDATTTTVPVATTLPEATTLAEASAELPDAPEGLADAVTAFYRFVGGGTEVPAGVSPGLATHVAAAGEPNSIDLAGEASWSILRTGSRIAVATIEEDAVVVVDDGDGWRVVGASLPRFGLGPWFGDTTRNVLIIGSDARWDEDVFRARADSLHVLFSNPAAGTGAIVGIPRDAWIPSPSGGNIRINSTLASSGPEGTFTAVEQLSGMELEGYIITGFLGFEIIARNYGPIEVNLPLAVQGGLPGFPDYPAGPQEIDAEELLLLARIRKTLPDGDFGRQLNGGRIIQSALSLAQTRGIEDLPRAVWILMEASHTDLSAEQLATLAATAFELDPSRVANVVLPGRTGDVGEASVVFLDDAGSAELWADAADGEIGGTGS